MKLADAIDRIRPSIVQISAELRQTATTHQTPIFGTGFIVNADGHVITALHVIDGVNEAIAKAPLGGDLRVGYAGPAVDEPTIQIRAAFIFRKATVVATDPTNDLALLRLPSDVMASFGGMSVGPSQVRNVDPRAVSLHSERPRDGTPLGVSGYPLGEPSLVTTSGAIANPWAFEAGPQRRDRYLADITVNPGNSGGAAFSLEDGGVLGVLVAGRLVPIQGAPGAAMAGLGVLVPSMAVVKFLDENKVGSDGARTRKAAPKKKGRR